MTQRHLHHQEVLPNMGNDSERLHLELLTQFVGTFMEETPFQATVSTYAASRLW